MDETLGFAFTNPTKQLGGLALFAVDESDEIQWYVPNPAEPHSLSISRTERQQSIPRTVALDINHRPGDYRLMAVFSPGVFSLEKLRVLVPAMLGGEDLMIGAFVLERTLRIEAAE
jgi:hypothetical protein